MRAAILPVCLAASAPLVLSMPGSAPDHPNCGPGAGDCFQPHPTPGCESEDCCDIVCIIDPYCCQHEWDEACVITALIHCEPAPVCGRGESCFVPHADPGCIHEHCCLFVCQVDPYCCDAAWDELCAGAATDLCSDRPCQMECAGGISEGEECRDNTNGGCSPDPPLFTAIECGEIYCGTVWAEGIRDTDWYELAVGEDTLIEWSVRSEFPSEISIMVGNCDDGFTVGAMTFGGWCEYQTATLSVGPGTYYLVVAPGTEYGPIYAGISCEDQWKKITKIGVFGPEYMAAVSCTPIPADCRWDVRPDGQVDVGDLLALLQAWGPNPSSRADFDGSGEVDARDLIELIAHWGPCP